MKQIKEKYLSGQFILTKNLLPARYLYDLKCAYINGGVETDDICTDEQFKNYIYDDSEIILPQYEQLCLLLNNRLPQVSLHTAMQQATKKGPTSQDHEIATLTHLQQLARLKIMNMCNYFVDHYSDDTWNNFISEPEIIFKLIEMFEDSIATEMLVKFKTLDK